MHRRGIREFGENPSGAEIAGTLGTLTLVAGIAFLAPGCGPESVPEEGDGTGPAPTTDSSQTSGSAELRAAAAAIFTGEGARWVDMTHPLSEDNVYWPTAERFQLEVLEADTIEAGYWYAANRFSGAEHGGTHVDAPYHFAADAWSTDQIPLHSLRGPAAVVDVRDSVRANRDYQVRVSDLEAWEAEHGRLPDGAMLLLDTGWAERWPDAEAVLGTADRGAEAATRLHFPGLDPDAARWLVEERDVDLVGIDTPSIDHGPSTTFPAHRILYEANVVGLENVARLGELPASGAFVMVLPMKIRGGSGGPARVVGVVPDTGGG